MEYLTNSVQNYLNKNTYLLTIRNIGSNSLIQLIHQTNKTDKEEIYKNFLFKQEIYNYIVERIKRQITIDLDVLNPRHDFSREKLNRFLNYKYDIPNLINQLDADEQITRYFWIKVSDRWTYENIESLVEVVFEEEFGAKLFIRLGDHIGYNGTYFRHIYPKTDKLIEYFDQTKVTLTDFFKYDKLVTLINIDDQVRYSPDRTVVITMSSQSY